MSATEERRTRLDEAYTLCIVGLWTTVAAALVSWGVLVARFGDALDPGGFAVGAGGITVIWIACAFTLTLAAVAFGVCAFATRLPSMSRAAHDKEHLAT